MYTSAIAWGRSRRGRCFSRSPTGWIVRPHQWNVSPVSNLLLVQTTCFLTPESALYNSLSCATPPCTQLRRTGASLAYLRTNHLPNSSKQYYKTHQPFFFFLKPYYRREQQQIPFVLMCLSSIDPSRPLPALFSGLCSFPSV